jgi:hypothetical protein
LRALGSWTTAPTSVVVYPLGTVTKHTHARTCTHARTPARTQAHTNTHTHALRHTRTHTHIHTQNGHAHAHAKTHARAHPPTPARRPTPRRPQVIVLGDSDGTAQVLATATAVVRAVDALAAAYGARRMEYPRVPREYPLEHLVVPVECASPEYPVSTLREYAEYPSPCIGCAGAPLAFLQTL